MSKSIKFTILSGYALVSLLALLLSIINPTFALIAVGLLAACFLFYLFLVGKLNLYHYVAILIPSIILSPFIQTPAGLPMIKLEDIWLLFGLILLIVKLAFTKDIKLVVPSYAKVFFVFIIWVAFTIFLSSFREPHYYQHNDWMEVYKNIKLLAIMLIAVNVKLDKEKTNKIVNTFLITLLAASLFGFMQYFNLLNVNSWLTPHYIFESNIRSLEMQGRVVATFGNPNIYGGALLLGIAFAFSQFMSSFKWRYAALLLIFFLAMTTSLSRTTLIASVVLIAVMWLMILRQTKKRIGTFASVLVLPFIALLGLQFAPQSFFYRMSYLDNLSLTDGSLSSRADMWQPIWETRTSINLFTGTGPTGGYSVTFDNEWLALLTLFGGVGVLLFIVLFGNMYHHLGKINSRDINFYNIAVKGLMIAYALYMITLPLFRQLQLAPMIILMFGIVLNKTATKEVSTHPEQTTD